MFLYLSLNPNHQSHPIKPPLFPSSNSNNTNIKMLAKKVCFKGRPKPQHAWKEWVANLEKTRQSTWKKAGIFDAIRGSTYNIKRDNEFVVSLAEKWCVETNTFVFSWGEATITLEDVIILGGFSVMGCSVVNPPHCKEVEKLQKEVEHSFAVIRRSDKNNQVSHYKWMEYFKGKGGELEHVALLVLWLSRYVFSTNHYNIISKYVFVLAINLALGTQFALGPAVLAAIYRDLRLLKHNIERCRNLDVWGLFQLVQLWAWERFLGLSPEPTSLARGEPRVARWHDIRKLKIENLEQELESAGNNFCWKPYGLNVRNWEIPKFYCDDDKIMVFNTGEIEQLSPFARCLRSCELVGVDCVEQYLPHRVGMQFGFDQDIPDSVPILNSDSKLACGTLSVDHNESPLSSAGNTFSNQEQNSVTKNTGSIVPDEGCTSKECINEDGIEMKANSRVKSPLSTDRNENRTIMNGNLESSDIDILNRIARLQRIIDIVKAEKASQV